VNLVALNQFEEGSTVDLKALQDAKLVGKNMTNVKILGLGEVTKKLTVKATKFSKSASSAIEKAGGKAEVI
jgi:large subunit ribosomal protein L15